MASHLVIGFDLLEDDKTIITTVTNYGYLLYTLNMLKSLKPFDLDKKVFIVCIDKKGAKILKNIGYNVFCIEDSTEQKELGKFCPWNTKGYDKICYLKLELIYRILSLNKNVLLIDGDIVFRKDLMDDHLPHRKMAEVELADAVIRICDLAGLKGYDLGGAIEEKLAYNLQRADHKLENREKEGGKQF
jgi:hypothetical protein